MALVEKINEDLKLALKSGDALRVSTLRMLQAGLHNKTIEKRTVLSRQQKPPEPLNEIEELDVIEREAKKRKEAILAYEKAGRADLAEKEKQELKILEEYLPEVLPETEIKEWIKKAIESTGALSQADLGKVMVYLKANLKGRVDWSTLSRDVLARLKKE
jgi:uncharacterized protein YqeY